VNIKELKTRESKLLSKLDRIRLEKVESEREAKRLSEKINTLQRQIKQITSDPTVSEHAVLRYVERVLGIDIDEIRCSILTDEVANQIRQLGSGRFPLGNGFKAVVKQNVVVSIIGDHVKDE